MLQSINFELNMDGIKLDCIAEFEGEFNPGSTNPDSPNFGNPEYPQLVNLDVQMVGMDESTAEFLRGHAYEIFKAEYE